MQSRQYGWFSDTVHMRMSATAEFSVSLFGNGGADNAAIIRVPGEIQVTDSADGAGVLFLLHTNDFPTPIWNTLEHEFYALSGKSDDGDLTINSPSRYEEHVSFEAEGVAYEVDANGIQFKASNADEPCYWSIPLINFTLLPPERSASLGNHPLRIDQGRYSHSFEFASEVAFIQLLPDFDERLKELRNGDVQSQATAVAVGRIPGGVCSAEKLDDWFPFDLVTLLSFASGVEVGSPWIELRSASGELTHRFHYRIGYPKFAECHSVIPEGSPSLGQFLTAALRSELFGDKALRIACKHASRAVSVEYSHLEDHYLHVTRAFEALNKRFGQSQTNLLLQLPEAYRSTIKETLRSASSEIRKQVVPPQAGPVVDRIAQRVINASQTENDFGISVLGLMQELGFCDAAVLDSVLVHNAKPITFAGAVSMYRGAAVHEGGFDFAASHDPEQAANFVAYMVDLLFRVILRVFDYEGTYNAFVGRTRGKPAKVGRVTPKTPPSALGFRRRARVQTISS